MTDVSWWSQSWYDDTLKCWDRMSQSIDHFWCERLSWAGDFSCCVNDWACRRDSHFHQWYKNNEVLFEEVWSLAGCAWDTSSLADWQS